MSVAFIVLLVAVASTDVARAQQCDRMKEQCLQKCEGLQIDFKCDDSNENSIASSCACVDSGGSNSASQFQEKALPVSDPVTNGQFATNVSGETCKELDAKCQDQCKGGQYKFDCQVDGDNGSAMASASSCSCVGSSPSPTTTSDSQSGTSDQQPEANNPSSGQTTGDPRSGTTFDATRGAFNQLGDGQSGSVPVEDAAYELCWTNLGKVSTYVPQIF